MVAQYKVRYGRTLGSPQETCARNVKELKLKSFELNKRLTIIQMASYIFNFETVPRISHSCVFLVYCSVSPLF